MQDVAKDEREVNRRAAVAYLRAAINSAEAPVRNHLRRRAAELILPRGKGPCCEERKAQRGAAFGGR